MHKLSDLNAYGAEYVGFADTRPYGITWRLIVDNIVATIQEDQPHLFVTTWDIDDMSSVDETGDTIDVNFTLLNVATNYVYFTDTAPAGITLVDNGSGSYTVSGITTMSHWRWVKEHTAIKPEADRNTTWSYQVDVQVPAGADNQSWSITVNYTGDGEEITDPLDQEFDPAVPEFISGHPIVTDQFNTDYSYRVVITSATAVIDLITSAGSGGTATWDGVARSFTIQGTKAQVNSHLSSLQLTTQHQTDWTLTYTLTNLASGTITVKTQNWVETVLNAESTNLGVARDYQSNTFNLIYSTDPVQIDDGTITGSPVYTVKLTLGADIGVILQSDDTAFPPAEWDSGTLTWTYVGSEADCNLALSKIAFAPTKNIFSSTTLKYQQWRGVTIQADATVALTGSQRTTAIPGANTYTFTSDAEFTPTFEQAHYLDYKVLVVGGGGGGGSYDFAGNASDLYYSYSSQTYFPSIYFKVSGGGGGGAVEISNSTNHIFNPTTVGNDTFAIVVGSGGAHGYTPSNVTSGWYPASDGGDTAITRITDSKLLVKAFGGWGGKSIASTGFGMTITGRTFPQFGDSGYYTVSLNEGGYFTSSRAGPTTNIENLGTKVLKSLHPYAITGGGVDGFWTYASTHQFYLGAENAVVSDIDGTSRRYGGGGTLRYYNETGDYYTYPGCGGFAGVYDTGNNGAVGAPAVDEGYTDGQNGIVIIKFTQPS